MTDKKLTRRRFIGTATAAAATLAVSPIGFAGKKPAARPANAGFKLKYAPYFGMFEAHAGKDPIDQIKFMADQGFRAMFDTGWNGPIRMPIPFGWRFISSKLDSASNPRFLCDR